MIEQLQQLEAAATAVLGKKPTHGPNLYVSLDHGFFFSVSMANYDDEVRSNWLPTLDEALEQIQSKLQNYDPKAKIRAQIAELEAQLNA